MARFSEQDTTSIYKAAEKFRDECLRADRSLLFDGEAIWTPENLDALHQVFVDAPDESERSFLEKFKDQVQPAGKEVMRLAGEVVAVYFLFPSNVGGVRKKQVVREVLGWGGDELPDDHLVAQAFSRGIGSGGQGYNTRRPYELWFLIDFVIAWKKLSSEEREEALADPWKFQDRVDSQDGAENRQLRHMLLHLIFPDHFERIASGNHKWRVADAFKGLAPNDIDDQDQRIYAIRQKLEQLLPGKQLDFYWAPLDVAWYDSAEPADGLASADLIHHKKQIVLYGPPGTGKTFRAKRLGQQIVRSAALSQWGAAKFFQEQDRVRECVERNVHRLQLHPAYTYEDFVRGLHIGEGGATEYRLGFLPSLVKEMEAEGPERLPHVLILDEINRTDLSRMLGECFSLLEDRDQEIKLPAADEPMSLRIPPDLYVIGTMNLIDQSVEQIDFALRRRFLWLLCPFDAEAMLAALKGMWDQAAIRNIDWSRVEADFERLARAATALNREIRSSPLLGEQYEIGHTYFFDIVSFLRQQLGPGARARKYYLWGRRGPLPALERLWHLSLRPLLHEYLSGLEASAREAELGRLESAFFAVPKDDA